MATAYSGILSVFSNLLFTSHRRNYFNAIPIDKGRKMGFDFSDIVTSCTTILTVMWPQKCSFVPASNGERRVTTSWMCLFPITPTYKKYRVLLVVYTTWINFKLCTAYHMQQLCVYILQCVTDSLQVGARKVKSFKTKKKLL